MRILGRSSLFRRLTVCIMLSGIASDGIQDLMFQYFKLEMGFTVQDFTVWLELFGVMGLATQTVLLRCLLAWMGEVWVLVLGAPPCTHSQRPLGTQKLRSRPQFLPILWIARSYAICTMPLHKAA